MATATRICKVCGTEYEYCHTARRSAGVFRWQDVACSPEHGKIYLARIIKSRSQNQSDEIAETDAESENVKSAAVVDWVVVDDDVDNDDIEDDGELDDEDEDELSVEDEDDEDDAEEPA